MLLLVVACGALLVTGMRPCVLRVSCCASERLLSWTTYFSMSFGCLPYTRALSCG